MKRLLIVYHTQGGHTGAMAEAVLRGARRAGDAEIVLKRAGETMLEDLLGCHGLIIGTPENFGYMSGGLKDFLDRTFYPVEGKLSPLPYAAFVSAGNDGTGAVTQIERIATGYGWKRVAEPLIVRKEIAADDLAACEDLGEAMASGVALGIF